MKKIPVVCNSQLSPLCHQNYERWSSDYYKNKNKNDGKFICLYCSRYIRIYNNKFYCKLSKNTGFFENIDCEIKAYLLGVIAGDGSVSKSILRIVSHAEDVETLKLFNLYICAGATFSLSRKKNLYLIAKTWVPRKGSTLRPRKTRKDKGIAKSKWKK